MIERIDNLIQLLTTAVCTVICIRCALLSRERERGWIFLGLSSFVFFLGDLYVQLYLEFYDKTPHYSNISYLGWYAGYLFLFLLLSDIQNSRCAAFRNRLLWLIPVFTAGMCIFYMQWDNPLECIVHAVVMTLLLRRAVIGLLCTRKAEPESARRRMLYINVLVVCAAEYITSTVSCFWMGDTLANPYFWFDAVLSFSFLVLPASLKKAVGK